MTTLEVSCRTADFRTQLSASVQNTFRALRHREFRTLWMAVAISAVGTWMQILALSLLVLEVSGGSAFALGTVSLAQACAFLTFALPGGSIVDRVDKRSLLLLTQSISAALAALLGVLTILGAIRLWMIVVFALLNGAVLSIDQPARAALLPALAPERDMSNAISLQTMTFNAASLLGPALGGLVVARLGYAANFFLNGASFFGVLLVLLLMESPAGPRPPLVGAPIRAALAMVRRDPVLPSVLSGYAAMLFLGPSLALLLPVYATSVLHVGSERLGVLFSSVGAGTVLGALLMASLRSQRYGRFYFIGLFVWTGSLITFALSRRFWLSTALLLFLGAGQTLAATSTVTLLQTRVPRLMRGRVMSLNTLAVMGVRPLGDFPAGELITIIGAPRTVLLGAGLVGSIATVVLTRQPAVRSG